MDKKDLILNEIHLGKEVANPDENANVKRFQALDSKMIVENSAPVVVGMLLERTIANLDSPNTDERREAMALAREFLPFMLKKKGIEKEIEAKKGGGISDSFLERLEKATGKSLREDESSDD